MGDKKPRAKTAAEAARDRIPINRSSEFRFLKKIGARVSTDQLIDRAALYKARYQFGIDILQLILSADSMAQMRKLAAAGLKFNAGQSYKAKHLKRKLPSGAQQSDIIRRLAKSKEFEDEPARELWPRFFGKLEEAGANPKTRNTNKGEVIRYDTENGKQKQLSFRGFENAVSKHRGKLRVVKKS